MDDPDRLDRDIIAILSEDGRTSNARISRKVGVSEGTVRRRLKNLVEKQYIHVVALSDAAKMGNMSQALIGVQVDPDKVDVVADTLKDFSEVAWVAVTTGTYDIFAWVTLQSAEALGVFLRTKVGTVLGVRRTETFVNLDKKRGNYVI